MEPKILESLLIFAVSLILPATMLAISLKKHPKWLSSESLAPFWSKLNFSGLIAASITSIITIILYNEYMLLYKSIAVIGVAAVTFILVQTFYTDFKYRKADRRILNLSNLILIALSGTFLYNYDNPNFVIYVIILLFCLSIGYIPGIGESDGRAITLALASAYPIIGLDGVKITVIIFFACLLIYIICNAIKEKNFKLGFVSKMSIPAVPLILLPALIGILAYPLVTS